MKKPILLVFSALALFALLAVGASAASYTVRPGDTMWRLAVSYEVGLDEIKRANPQIKNPDLIYPGDVLEIPSVDSSVLAFEREVVRLVNVERRRMGLGELTYDWEIGRVARIKSEDMRDKRYFSHTSPTYGSPFQMLRSFGISYRSAGENIARGQTTPAAVVSAWMASPGHRANILNASFTHIGVGYASGGNYWTQIFIGR